VDGFTLLELIDTIGDAAKTTGGSSGDVAIGITWKERL
jgi:hypothetical protein